MSNDPKYVVREVERLYKGLSPEFQVKIKQMIAELDRQREEIMKAPGVPGL